MNDVVSSFLASCCVVVSLLDKARERVSAVVHQQIRQGPSGPACAQARLVTCTNAGVRRGALVIFPTAPLRMPWAATIHQNTCSQPRHATSQRAVLGIEPRTSRTRSENHTTRPNSQLVQKFTLLYSLLCVLPGLWRVIVGVHRHNFICSEPATAFERPAEQEPSGGAFADSTSGPSYSNA